jgi:hypothetical protein
MSMCRCDCMHTPDIKESMASTRHDIDNKQKSNSSYGKMKTPQRRTLSSLSPSCQGPHVGVARAALSTLPNEEAAEFGENALGAKSRRRSKASRGLKSGCPHRDITDTHIYTYRHTS